ncbi:MULTISPECIES: fimbrial protein [Rahnella]|uniref:Type 1 fimbrial protein n=1 Tax=Rahnella laticis TaxID=2787622 RepID=A0ABS0E290_9GAMM|nr:MULTISPECIES: type 1 fimbrial protein [Rahnella]MBF7979190.1 type 1 fimbrial protein [Rahnella laticis]MBF7999545.1 type 1 fimbrial protein [Rahnella sp. LAC-M12]
MNAKKTCSMALILTALSAAGMPAACAQNASINVTGSLVNPTCTVSGAYQEDFGEVYIDKVSSSTLSARLINLTLTNCSNTTVTATATFSGTLDAGTVIFTNMGSATGVGVRAYRNSGAGQTVSNGHQWTKNVDATSHSVTFPTVFTLVRKYVASNNPRYVAMTSGTVLAVISVSYSYS